MIYKNSDDFPIKSWLNVEIVQQTRYGWTTDNILPLIDNWNCINACALICHDEEEAEPHCHLMINFKYAVPTHNILNHFESLNISFNELEKIKSKRFASAIAYLTHENAPNKHLYSRDKVISFGIDLNKTIDDEITLLKNSSFNINNFISQIETGEIKGYNFTDFISGIDYTKYKVRIDRAFNYRQFKLEKERSGKRNMECIFITGPSDCGKTTYARQIAKNKGYACFVASSGKSPLDDYKGQECIVLDDLRDDTFSFNDLLKLTDNDTDSFVGCRYYNKSIFECKLIIATSTQPITQFYSNGEDMTQLFRRFPMMIKMTEKYVDFYEFDISTKTYVNLNQTIWNNVYTLKLQKEKKKQLLNDIVGAMETLSVSNNPNSNLETIPNDNKPFDSKVFAI